MIVIHILAGVALFPQFWSWGAAATLFILYWVTACLGVTLGYHRLLSHRSFKVPQWLARFFATCGALSAEYGPVTWVGLHRQHHKHSDKALDPHNSKRGIWWSHIGWMFVRVPGEKRVRRYAGDMRKDPYFVWLDKYFLFLQIPLGLTLYLLGGWSYVLWGIFLRLVHIVRAYSIFKDKMKAIQVCVNRFDDETKQAFLELYDKVDGDVDLDKLEDKSYD